MPGESFHVEVRPNIPAQLARMPDLAHNLLYTWDRRIRRLFARIDPILWHECGHNPRVFLRRCSQARLEDLAEDRSFLDEYQRTLAMFDGYQKERPSPLVKQHLKPTDDLVAYFCLEYGLHESLPIYSGGLGILAGDHCKAASDLGLPFVAVGLLYRQGYFHQEIAADGQQVAIYASTDFDALPLNICVDDQGAEIHVATCFPGRDVYCRIWAGRLGHITIYLLDTDLECNQPEDRAITHQLYGGGKETRIMQEMLLGIGGVRALRSLGLRPTAWHMNEGHAAFMVLERCREAIQKGLDFDAAMESVACAHIFTTHTPVPAGHDIFDSNLVRHYLDPLVAQLNIGMDAFLALGHSAQAEYGFNMTALAMHGARFFNGVSRIHGNVASIMEGYIWPELAPEDNPINYITNGVHVPTFLHQEWANLFNVHAFDWTSRMLDNSFWDQSVEDIDDYRYWSLHQSIKSDLLAYVGRRVRKQLKRNRLSAHHIQRRTQYLHATQSDILVMGFARRFATYKRAMLLFHDQERLARLLNDPARPVLLLFAGKAHPKDEPGQHLIRSLCQLSEQPEFEGKVVMIEDYDLALARYMVAGVDVWLNSPEYPLEASGTSGQKAAINGALNLSVLDGWWGEGYNGDNGWAIRPANIQDDPALRDRIESREMIDILEDEVIPTYFARGNAGYSPRWVQKSKNSMKTMMPEFNAQRMVGDYLQRFYGPATRQNWRINENNSEQAVHLARWKQKIRSCWSGVTLELSTSPATVIHTKQTMHIEVKVRLHGLTPEDLCVESLFGLNAHGEDLVNEVIHEFAYKHMDGEYAVFGLEFLPPRNGLLHYKVRMYPNNVFLSHPFEMGCMRWL